MTSTVLRIDSSARTQGSVSRDLTGQILKQLAPTQVINRDLGQPVPQLTEAWVNANFTPEADRTDAQRAELALSDSLVSELIAADTLVIGLPIYNFSLPASLKAWIDQVARAGVTFTYSADGPQGLLTGKRAIIALASGGTKAQSEIDFATDYMIHVLGFLGITDVSIVAADQMAIAPQETLERAHQTIAQIAA